MNRNIVVAAAAFASAAVLALPPTKPDAKPTDPDPRNSQGAFGPPAQSIPHPLPGVPATLRAPEGTGIPLPTEADANLVRALTAALLDDPAAPAVKGLSISVVDGQARLRGTVSSQTQKDAVSAKAASVAGRSKVANDIVVAP